MMLYRLTPKRLGTLSQPYEAHICDECIVGVIKSEVYIIEALRDEQGVKCHFDASNSPVKRGKEGPQ